MLRALALAVAFATVLAGCVGKEPVDPAATTPSTPTVPTNVATNGTAPVSNATAGTYSEESSLTFSGVRASSSVASLTQKNCLSFYFAQNATITGGNVTATWTANGPFSSRFELRFDDLSDKNPPLAKAAGASPIALKLDGMSVTNRTALRLFLHLPPGESGLVYEQPFKLAVRLDYVAEAAPKVTQISCSSTA